MDPLQQQDVPYGNDWDSVAEVAAWAEEADRLRPWRARIRDRITERVAALPPGARVVELGSGPGFLAQRVLEGCPDLETYTLLDFSAPMLALSRERLAGLPAARFVQASFKDEGWTRRIEGPVDCILSMQAVHELRHKRHARPLYEQAHRILATPGRVLICDHTPFDDTESSVALYMTEAEQQASLTEAGFSDVHALLTVDSLVLYQGTKRA